VAGEATSKSIGSKIKLVVAASWMISPLLRQSFLLSSNTVFIFSIQTASTGPSKINHLRSGFYWRDKEWTNIQRRYVLHSFHVSVAIYSKIWKYPLQWKRTFCNMYHTWTEELKKGGKILIIIWFIDLFTEKSIDTGWPLFFKD